MDSRVGDQVGLELSQIYIESSVETKGSRDGRNYLGDQTVEIGVARTTDLQILSADLVNSFVVDEEGAIGVLQSRVSCQDSIIRL